MTSLNILSGGAALGLVESLTEEFKERTGFDIAGEGPQDAERASMGVD